MDHTYKRVKWGPGQPRVRTSKQNWDKPFKWNRDAAREGRTDVTVFCLSLGDIWDNEVNPAWRSDAFEVIRATPNLTWLLLSKRIGNAIDMAREAGGLPPNCALGATMASQEEWDRDAIKLLKAAAVLEAKFTFASVEPMLGPVTVPVGCMPDWVIVGGESGKHARPMHPDWARSLRDQCNRARTPFLLKQWGEWTPEPDWYENHRVSLPCLAPLADGWSDDGGLPGPWMVKVGKAKAGRTLDGIIHDGFPACISGGA